MQERQFKVHGMALFYDKVTYNFSIKADVKALFAGEDGFSEPKRAGRSIFHPEYK